MITKEQAIALGTLGHGELHYGECTVRIGPRGGTVSRTERWRPNGACKTWKTRPDEFSLPIKYGFNGPYGYLTQMDAVDWHLAEDCQPTVTDERLK